jgi:predicted adenine nucleotide alpha hydrolase (AANH) superfamily ATPase
VHICCSVDSHYFLQKLRESYPDEPLTGFFYDPNIQPYSEYRLRLLDVQRSCQMLGIPLIEGAYDTEGWLASVRGLEHEPEKGARCSVCFDGRLEETAKQAVKLLEPTFTSTLLASPKKSLKQLARIADAIAEQYGLRFIAPDYRKHSGTEEQNRLARADALYRQDYCGCLFGLTQQRAQQGKLADELFVPLSGQIQPESIEARIALYEQRWDAEHKQIAYTIVKQRFLNWRLLWGLVRIRGEVTPSHILPLSTLKGRFSRGKIAYEIDEVYYMNRDEIRFVTLAHYNVLAKTSYPDVTALLYSPPSYASELAVRRAIDSNPYSLSLIIVVEEVPENKIEIELISEAFEDIQEELIVKNMATARHTQTETAT